MSLLPYLKSKNAVSLKSSSDEAYQILRAGREEFFSLPGHLQVEESETQR